MLKFGDARVVIMERTLVFGQSGAQGVQDFILNEFIFVESSVNSIETPVDCFETIVNGIKPAGQECIEAMQLVFVHALSI